MNIPLGEMRDKGERWRETNLRHDHLVQETQETDEVDVRSVRARSQPIESREGGVGHHPKLCSKKYETAEKGGGGGEDQPACKRR